MSHRGNAADGGRNGNKRQILSINQGNATTGNTTFNLCLTTSGAETQQRRQDRSACHTCCHAGNRRQPLNPPRAYSRAAHPANVLELLGSNIVSMYDESPVVRVQQVAQLGIVLRSTRNTSKLGSQQCRTKGAMTSPATHRNMRPGP